MLPGSVAIDLMRLIPEGILPRVFEIVYGRVGEMIGLHLLIDRQLMPALKIVLVMNRSYAEKCSTLKTWTAHTKFIIGPLSTFPVGSTD